MNKLIISGLCVLALVGLFLFPLTNMPAEGINPIPGLRLLEGNGGLLDFIAILSPIILLVIVWVSPI